MPLFRNVASGWASRISRSPAVWRMLAREDGMEQGESMMQQDGRQDFNSPLRHVWMRSSLRTTVPLPTLLRGIWAMRRLLTRSRRGRSVRLNERLSPRSRSVFGDVGQRWRVAVVSVPELGDRAQSSQRHPAANHGLLSSGYLGRSDRDVMSHQSVC